MQTVNVVTIPVEQLGAMAEAWVAKGVALGLKLAKEGGDMPMVDEYLLPEQDEYTIATATPVLKAKGYCVKSFVAFSNLMEANGITATKRGRTNWYPADKINAIPVKN